MPYGISQEDGGDSPANTKFMENCVKAVKGKKDSKGKEIDEGSAVAICKATLHRHKTGPNKKKLLQS